MVPGTYVFTQTGFLSAMAVLSGEVEEDLFLMLSLRTMRKEGGRGSSRVMKYN